MTEWRGVMARLEGDYPAHHPWVRLTGLGKLLHGDRLQV